METLKRQCPGDVFFAGSCCYIWYCYIWSQYSKSFPRYKEKQFQWQLAHCTKSACDTDTYFENIQTMLIFLKYYCCVSCLKYYKIIFFFMNNWWGEIFFISRFNQAGLKEIRNKKVFRLWNLLNFIVLTSKLLLQKMSHVTLCENNIIGRK